ncbi:ABC transporter substrate-binding protein [Agrobacterium sp. B1(2019)]|uniref:ABC transporter substrate-binding protein n=1 Tax=Agrobacterium sp. B1(2019) TaxID=2607032 RepID=UPI0011EDAB25|nr:ABC transporter substrate-binding protein [Agrobacterium sp. B1(2019)]TZG32158.1 ABC transporter substrate-binding protein [Agrobacterium sp. B1(2019)]
MRKMLVTATMALSLGVSSLAVAEPLKIGMITTLSGGGAGLGVDTRDGFMLAIKQSGNKDVTVVTEDDAQKPELAVQIADKMIQSDNVDVLTGIVWSNLLMAVVPGAVAQGKFYVSTNAAPAALAGKGCNKLYFNAAYQNDNLHEAMGQYANKDFKKMFILAPNYPAGKDSLAGFKRYYKGEVVSEVYTKVGQTDYAAEIAQMRASGADGIFSFLPGGMGIAFMKQFAQSGVKIPVMGPGFSFSQDVLPAIGDAAIGAKASGQWVPDFDTEVSKKFLADFQKEYNRLPSIYAVQAYDAAQLILSAAAKVSVKDTDAFHAELLKADIKSPRGNFKFNTNQHPIQDLYITEVVKKDGVLTNKTVEKIFSDHGDAYAQDCKI